MTSVNVNRLTKHITVNVQLRGLRILGWRLWLASIVFRAGAAIAGVKINFDEKPGRQTYTNSSLVTGNSMPKDLLAMLEKYGMPPACTSFIIECAGPELPVLLTYTGYISEPDRQKGVWPTETRTFNLVEAA